MFFHYTEQLHGILQDFLLPREGLHLSAERSKFRMPNFLLSDAFRRTLKIPGENPDLHVTVIAFMSVQPGFAMDHLSK